jgi:putative membrane protein
MKLSSKATVLYIITNLGVALVPFAALCFMPNAFKWVFEDEGMNPLILLFPMLRGVIQPGIVLALVLSVCAVSMIFTDLYRQSIEFGLEDDGFHKRSGVINLSSVLIQYSKIQDVRITRNLLERILGLSTVEIDVQSLTLDMTSLNRFNVIRGLEANVAEDLRRALLARCRAA